MLPTWPRPPPQAPLCVQKCEHMEGQGRGGRGGPYTSLQVLVSPPSLQELGFTSFIRTLREGDHERLGKKKEEL